MKLKYLLLSLLVLGAATFVSCSTDNDAINETTEKAKTLKTSSALTYVSIFSDEDCTLPLVENVPLTGSVTNVNFVLTYGMNNVYVKYPTANGTKVIEMAVPDATPSASTSKLKADPGSYEYFMTESDRYITLPVALPEDAVKNYVTNEDGFTNYHSSGVAMFEDTWPSKSNVDNASGGGLFGDFNDLVVDYDLEATVNDEANSSQTWKEDLKVVMHVRAMGGGYPQKFGLLLEGLDKKFVDESKTEIKVTLGNYATAVDPLTAEVKWDGNHPIIYINELQKLINKTSAAANGLTLTKVGSSNLYNTSNDVNLNVAKGLFTITVTFRGIDRNQLTKDEGDAQIENYKNAVINTREQNFFLVTKQAGKTYEIHMQNYAPTSSYTTYETDKTDKAAGVVVPKDDTKTYTSADGQIWAFKTPVLTRHATEHSAFASAYPLYLDWVVNHNASSANWYIFENANHETGPDMVTFANGVKKNPLIYIIEEW
jgi:LruC domain-containing protein